MVFYPERFRGPTPSADGLRQTRQAVPARTEPKTINNQTYFRPSDAQNTPSCGVPVGSFSKTNPPIFSATFRRNTSIHKCLHQNSAHKTVGDYILD
jgi:hypothetical protein